MAPVTEIVTARLKPGRTAIKSPTSEEGKSFDWLYQYLNDYGGVQYGMRSNVLEDKQKLVEVVVWDDYDTHKKFLVHEGVNKFVEKFLSNTAEDPEFHMRVFNLDPPPAKLLEAPATELLISHFPAAEATESRMAAFDRDVEKFFSGSKAGLEGRCLGYVSGWSLEEYDSEKIGGKARIHLSLMSWPSYAVHMDFRDTQAFKDSVGFYRQEGIPLEMFHVGTEADA